MEGVWCEGDVWDADHVTLPILKLHAPDPSF